jgi:post-segregation antitoxin (ccd killing protein)
MTRKNPSEKRKEKRWRAQNREAILSINAFIERHGLLADKLRYRPQTSAPMQTSPGRSGAK